MLPYAHMSVSRVARGFVLTLLATGLVVCFTWPIAGKLDSVGRLNTADGHWSLWCITWVAHALVEAPTELYHANIFYPHRNTLAYSEANIVPGVLGIPAYLATRSPFATHNTVVLLGFAFSFLCGYALAHYLTRHVAASVLCGLAFAYCPFVFARTAHIQLLMIFGLPWSLHMMHRLIDRPNARHAVALGFVLVIQALACAYYGIFAGLTVGLGVLFYAVTRRLWASRAYWGYVALAAVIAVGVVAPFFRPYITVQQELGFARTIDDASMYSADVGAWLASSAHAHRWLLGVLRGWNGWNEVLFPGFLTTILGLAGIWIGWRTTRTREQAPQTTQGTQAAPAAEATPAESLPVWPGLSRTRETTLFYLLIGAIAFWTSFGPKAGLYTLLYHTIPVFSFLRAPARAGIMVALALSVCMAIGIAQLLRSRSRRTTIVAGVGLSVLLGAELMVAPLGLSDAPPVNRAYQLLARLPRGPVAEFPFFYERPDFPRHARYMLNSTYHWQPLINGYSDHIPGDFRQLVRPVSSFPSREAFRLLRERRARYVLVHWNYYDRRSRERMVQRLDTYRDFLRPLHKDDEVWLFTITRWPDE
jgi:hypothetical protein